MDNSNFTVAEFFRLGMQVAAQESALRTAEADRAAEREIRLTKAGIAKSGVRKPDSSDD